MDANQLKIGDLVFAELFGGKHEKRIVVAVCGKTVYLATEREISASSSRGREPECVGFNEQYVGRGL